MDEDQGLELTEGNIETVLDEIRPYLVGELSCHPTYFMRPPLIHIHGMPQLCDYFTVVRARRESDTALTRNQPTRAIVRRLLSAGCHGCLHGLPILWRS